MINRKSVKVHVNSSLSMITALFTVTFCEPSISLIIYYSSCLILFKAVIGLVLPAFMQHLGVPQLVLVRLVNIVENWPISKTHIDFVNNNPSAFTNAFFDFAWIKVYQ
jgi:hypothetical protein